MASKKSKAFSFGELLSRDELIDFPEDDEEDSKKPKRNPFDFGDNDVTFESESKFVSRSEVNDFFKASRGITIGDDDEPLGEAWGGAEYSLKNEKIKSEPVQSARLRSGSGTQTSSSSYPGRVSQAQPSRPHPPSSSTQKSLPAWAAKSSASATAPTRTVASSATRTPAPRSTPSATAAPRAGGSIPAGVVRDKISSSAAAPNKAAPAPNKAAALQSVSSSISDAINSSAQISVNEYYRLQKEVAQLRRDLQAAKQSRLKAPPVIESVKRIIRGQLYSLELHKSLKDKVELLNCALRMHDGNAIIAVILFLRKTVKKTIFLNEVSKRPAAVHHLCKFLKDHYEFDELAQLYRILGRYEEAALLKLGQVSKSREPSDRLTTLRMALRDDLQPYVQLSELTSTVKDYISLLEMQITVEHADAKAELERRNMMMTTHPRQATLPLCPVVTSLYYCCFYHYEEPETQRCSPLSIKNTYKLSDKQFEWTALASRSKVRRWKDIDDILTGKGWFGSSKSKSLIGFEKVVHILHQNKAPEDVLSKYLRLIDDQNKRISLATKCKCHDVVIETFVGQKDRQKLEQYREHLPAHAPQQHSITTYMRNSQIRWKN